MARLPEFDALFIRDTTFVNHYTYRFSRRATAEGLVVIDDPESILSCNNKVYLAELLTRHNIPAPRTLMVHRDNVDQIISSLGLPCVLKQPDSSFSLGVVKVESEQELLAKVDALLQKSELIVAQEYLPTEFDWRVGILDRRPLFVCKYFMAAGHWQIVKREQGRTGYEEGPVQAVAVAEAPEDVVKIALKAANLIGDGLYGVDIKQVGNRCYVIEVNDNPNVDAGNEDGVLKDALYREIMGSFVRRIEARKLGEHLMAAAPALHAFAGYGIELEYMIVDRQTLAVLPIADALLQAASGSMQAEVDRGRFGWSNELVLHLVELKNARPDPALEPLAAGFQAEVEAINRLLQPMGARLMPSGMHPWMDPAAETRLWPHDQAPIYQAYDRIFDCQRHGRANLQSMHLNLPFADDAEFARLHAAVRLVLPILPALAASSPIADGQPSGYLDTRMATYCSAVHRVPSVIGQVIPDTISSRAEYEAQVLEPMYRDIAPLDPQGVLQHEWLNARGAIPRFDRNAIEIRVIDVQECPQADLAIAAAATAVIRSLYDDKWSPLAMQQAISTDSLARILHACIRDADQAVIDDAGYLRLLGLSDRQYRAGELWRHLINRTGLNRSTFWVETLRVMLEHGPLARRILRALGNDHSNVHLQRVYRALCDCLETGRLFLEK